MQVLVILAFVAMLATPSGVFAADANPESNARAKPTAAQKRCLAATRRVERQRDVIDEAQQRMARDRNARESCRTRRSCERLERALKAGEARRERYAKQLAQFESEAAQICASATGSR